MRLAKICIGIFRPPFCFPPGAFLFFIMFAVASLSCGEKQFDEALYQGRRADLPDQVFEGFEMTITENGIKQGWLKADRAEKYEKKKLFNAQNLKVIFYTSSGEIKSVMTSRRGIIRTDTGDMEALDSVVVISRDSTKTLETERLIWKKKENIIVGDTAVVITSRRGVVRGDGIKADAGFENLEVKNPTGDIHVLGNEF